mgnify:CR=1 FL=1
MENEFFTDPTNIIIKHLNKDFPEITRSPGPLAFSEEKYINEIYKREICVSPLKSLSVHIV